MKNKPYDLYEIPLIQNLKDMITQKKEQKPDDIAFTYSKGQNQIVKKTYGEFFDEVNAIEDFGDDNENTIYNYNPVRPHLQTDLREYMVNEVVNCYPDWFYGKLFSQ